MGRSDLLPYSYHQRSKKCLKKKKKKKALELEKLLAKTWHLAHGI